MKWNETTYKKPLRCVQVYNQDKMCRKHYSHDDDDERVTFSGHLLSSYFALLCFSNITLKRK